jgi:hypothetical protein
MFFWEREGACNAQLRKYRENQVFARHFENQNFLALKLYVHHTTSRGSSQTDFSIRAYLKKRIFHDHFPGTLFIYKQN